MRQRKQLLVIPFIAFTLCSCSFLDFFKKDSEGDSSKNHTVNIGEFRNAVNLSYKNFTLTSKQTKNGVEEDYTTLKALEDGSFYQKCAENKSEFYWKRDTDGSYIRINKYNDSWVVDHVINKSTFETDYYTDDSELLWTINGFVSSYTELTYNETSNLYETNASLKGSASNIALRFDNKKLAYVCIENSSSKIDITLTDYNSTNVDFDSLQLKNNLYVKGRTFTFKELRCQTPIPNLNVEEFNSKNANATLSFDETDKFSMHFNMNFMSPFTEQDYIGTYSYNKIEQTVSLMLVYNGGIVNISCSLSIDPNNYSDGAILITRLYAPSYNLDAYVDFYIK